MERRHRNGEASKGPRSVISSGTTIEGVRSEDERRTPKSNMGSEGQEVEKGYRNDERESIVIEALATIILFFILLAVVYA